MMFTLRFCDWKWLILLLLLFLLSRDTHGISSSSCSGKRCSRTKTFRHNTSVHRTNNAAATLAWIGSRYDRSNAATAPHTSSSSYRGRATSYSPRITFFSTPMVADTSSSTTTSTTTSGALAAVDSSSPDGSDQNEPFIAATATQSQEQSQPPFSTLLPRSRLSEAFFVTQVSSTPDRNVNRNDVRDTLKSPLPPGVVDDPVLTMADSFVNVFASVGKLLGNIPLPSWQDWTQPPSDETSNAAATMAAVVPIMSDAVKRSAVDAEWTVNLTDTSPPTTTPTTGSTKTTLSGTNPIDTSSSGSTSTDVRIAELEAMVQELSLALQEIRPLDDIQNDDAVLPTTTLPPKEEDAIDWQESVAKLLDETRDLVESTTTISTRQDDDDSLVVADPSDFLTGETESNFVPCLVSNAVDSMDTANVSNVETIASVRGLDERTQPELNAEATDALIVTTARLETSESTVRLELEEPLEINKLDAERSLSDTVGSLVADVSAASPETTKTQVPPTNEEATIRDKEPKLDEATVMNKMEDATMEKVPEPVKAAASMDQLVVESNELLREVSSSKQEDDETMMIVEIDDETQVSVVAGTTVGGMELVDVESDSNFEIVDTKNALDEVTREEYDSRTLAVEEASSAVEVADAPVISMEIGLVSAEVAALPDLDDVFAMDDLDAATVLLDESTNGSTVAALNTETVHTLASFEAKVTEQADCAAVACEPTLVEVAVTMDQLFDGTDELLQEMMPSDLEEEETMMKVAVDEEAVVALDTTVAMNQLVVETDELLQEMMPSDLEEEETMMKVAVDDEEIVALDTTVAMNQLVVETDELLQEMIPSDLEEVETMMNVAVDDEAVAALDATVALNQLVVETGELLQEMIPSDMEEEETMMKSAVDGGAVAELDATVSMNQLVVETDELLQEMIPAELEEEKTVMKIAVDKEATGAMKPLVFDTIELLQEMTPFELVDSETMTMIEMDDQAGVTLVADATVSSIELDVGDMATDPIGASNKLLDEMAIEDMDGDTEDNDETIVFEVDDVSVASGPPVLLERNAAEFAVGMGFSDDVAGSAAPSQGATQMQLPPDEYILINQLEDPTIDYSSQFNDAKMMTLDEKDYVDLVENVTVGTIEFDESAIVSDPIDINKSNSGIVETKVTREELDDATLAVASATTLDEVADALVIMMESGSVTPEVTDQRDLDDALAIDGLDAETDLVETTGSTDLTDVTAAPVSTQGLGEVADIDQIQDHDGVALDQLDATIFETFESDPWIEMPNPYEATMVASERVNRGVDRIAEENSDVDSIVTDNVGDETDYDDTSVVVEEAIESSSVQYTSELGLFGVDKPSVAFLDTTTSGISISELSAGKSNDANSATAIEKSVEQDVSENEDDQPSTSRFLSNNEEAIVNEEFGRQDSVEPEVLNSEGSERTPMMKDELTLSTQGHEFSDGSTISEESVSTSINAFSTGSFGMNKPSTVAFIRADQPLTAIDEARDATLADSISITTGTLNTTETQLPKPVPIDDVDMYLKSDNMKPTMADESALSEFDIVSQSDILESSGSPAPDFDLDRSQSIQSDQSLGTPAVVSAGEQFEIAIEKNDVKIQSYEFEWEHGQGAVNEIPNAQSSENVRLQGEESVKVEDTQLAAENDYDLPVHTRTELDADEISDDDWVASVRVAQMNIGTKIVGVDIDDIESFQDDDKARDSDQNLVNDLSQSVSESKAPDSNGIETVADEVDLVAALQAIEAIERLQQIEAEAKLRQREEWNQNVVEAPRSKVEDEQPQQNWTDLTLAQLKVESERRGLSKSGRKEKLVERLQAYSSSSGVLPDSTNSHSIGDNFTDWSSLKLSDLKKEMAIRGLSTSGNKNELVAALMQADQAIEQSTHGDVNFTDVENIISEGGVDTIVLDDQEYGDFTNHVNLLGDDDDEDHEAVSDPAIGTDNLFPNIADVQLGKDGEDDMNELARAAREAVALFEASNGLDSISVTSSSLRDWSKLSIVQLRTESKGRGLPTVGSKNELIASLESFDMNDIRSNEFDDDDVDQSIDDFEFNFDDLDFESLGKAAREAVLLYESDDEPTDEALWAIENEIEQGVLALEEKPMENEIEQQAMDFQEEKPIELKSAPVVESRPPVVDYTSMTVSQLKEELSRRGLRMTGKKSTLITRIHDSDRTM